MKEKLLLEQCYLKQYEKVLQQHRTDFLYILIRYGSLPIFQKSANVAFLKNSKSLGYIITELLNLHTCHVVLKAHDYLIPVN